MVLWVGGVGGILLENKDVQTFRLGYAQIGKKKYFRLCQDNPTTYVVTYVVCWLVGEEWIRNVVIRLKDPGINVRLTIENYVYIKTSMETYKGSGLD